MKDRKPPPQTEIYGSPPEPKKGSKTRHFGTKEDEGPKPHEPPGRKGTPPLKGEGPNSAPQDAAEHFEHLAKTADSEGRRSSVPPEYVRKEIALALQEALGRRGAPGLVRIEGMSVCVKSGEVELSCALGSWVQTWPQMSSSERAAQTSKLAQAICQNQPHRPSSGPRLPFTIDSRLVWVAIIASVFSLYYLFFGRSTEVSSKGGTLAFRGSDGPQSANMRAESGVIRDARVCASTMSRIFRGGSVTVADVAGWTVEVALLRLGSPRPLSEEPALRKYVKTPENPRGSRFIWEGEGDLASINTSDTLVKVRVLSIEDTPPEISGVALSFSGTLVDPYFTEAGRSRYYHIAHSLAQELNADHAALYARCAEIESHALGSWFQGKDAGDAATSLVYFMGIFASPRHMDTSALASLPGGELNHRGAFLKIASNTQAIDRAALAAAVGSEGGMAMGGPTEAVTITFPFRDGNRASRSSRTLARISGLASQN